MQRGSLLVAVVCYALAILIFINSFSRLMLDSTILGTRRNGISGQLNTPSKARNSSLGFGAIYVLTEDPTTWRVQGLIQAAESVGLYLNVPVQQHLSTEEVESQLSGAAVRAKPAVARLTLNYLTLLEEFLNTTLETVLFVKNDVEFSIYIKTQAALFSKAIWANVPNAERPDIDTVHADDYPYGFDTWDVLWLGHYGIEFTVATEVFANTDPYALPWSQLSSNFNEYYQSLRSKFVDEGIQQQQVLRGIAPIATEAPPSVEETKEQNIDDALHIACKDLAQRCLVPVPELMHHHRVLGQQILNGDKNEIEVVQDLRWWRDQHKYTYNVRWSAHCNSAEVGEKLGDRWQCLPGRYDELA